MKKVFIFLGLFVTYFGFSQQTTSPKFTVSKAAFFKLSPPLQEMIKKGKYIPKESEENKNELEFEPKFNGKPGPDPLSIFQKNKTQIRENFNDLVNFDGVSNLDHVAPPDTQGDVSSNHYMQCVNGHTAIYDRDGNTIVNPFPTSDFWEGTPYDDRNDGDAVILWDEDAERWMVTQFYVPDNGNQYLLIAISQTDDPTGQYYQYAFQYQYMPDYPKWAVWPDAYYMGANAFDQGNYKGAYVSAFERDKMLIGDAGARVITFGADDTLWSVFPADADIFPDDGTDCPFISDEVTHTNGNNEVYIYNFHADWNDTANSTFQHITTLNVADYGLFNSEEQAPQQNVNQKLDLLHYRIMYRPYYRHFDDHESLCMVRTVNDNDIAAIRWYEFRNTGNGWEVYQQGTYNPGDGLWRWMPSIAMNKDGDIAIGYSVSGDNMHPSIRITGRHAGDQLGVMTVDETELLAGQNSQDGHSRWGDYSMMSVDPVDNKSFWFTTEYSTGNLDWRTRIAHFEFPNQCVEPTDQASDIQANAQSETQIDVSWTRGNGDKVIVIAKKDSAVDSNPESGTNYTADAQFGSGDEIGNGNYVVYNGTGTSVSVTGLSASTTYHFSVYEYNNTDTCYLTPGAAASTNTHGLASVETLSMLDINDVDAQGQGKVIDENGSQVTERGLCWNTSPNPTTADSHASNGTGTGTYTVNLTGLTANTTYYVRAYAINSSGTAYGDNVEFTTLCGTISNFPFTEGFEDGNLPNCWSNEYVTDTQDWSYEDGGQNDNPANAYSGNFNALFYNGSRDPNVTKLITPPFNFSNFSSATLDFWHVQKKWGNDQDELRIYYKTSASGAWNLLTEYTDEVADWTLHSIDLPNLSDEYFVAFEATGQYGYGVGIDDVQISVTTVGEATVTTDLIYDITSNSAVAQGSVTDEGASAVTERGICWGTGYNPDISGNHTANGTGTGTYTVDLTGLTDNTTYHVRAYAINSAGTAYGHNISFATGYCSSNGSTTYQTSTTKVIFNTIDNNSGKPSGYSDYTNLSTVVKQNQNYNLSIQVNTDGNYTIKTKVWIDWNQNMIFNDAGEEYDLGEANNVADGLTSNSPLAITIPADAKLGRTRMRVSSRFSSYPQPCDADFDGEVEDYTVIITKNCDNVAYWNGTDWLDKDNAVLNVSNLTDKLIFINKDLTTNSTNIEACAMQIAASKTLNISANDYVSVENDIKNYGSILIEDQACLVQTSNSSTIEGAGIYKINRISQNMEEQTDYGFWSTPIQSFTFGGIVPNAWRYYSYDANNQAWHQETASSIMQPGVGYAISAPVNHNGGVIDVDFVNTNIPFNNGDISVPVYITGTGAQGDDDWNFAGNPYPSPIDFDKLANDNPNIEGTFYLWTNCAGLTNGQHQQSGFTTYNVGSGATSACNGNGPKATQYISVAQGFGIEANTAGNLVYKNSHRVTNQSGFINKTTEENRVWLDFTNNTGFNQILVGFFDEATDQKDRLFDAHSFDSSTFALYSLINNEKFSIQGLSQWNNNDRIIKLGYTTNVAGTHQITINRYEGIFNQGVNIYLKDLNDNSIHDLKSEAYTFSTDAGTFDDRFLLICSGTVTNIDDNNQIENINLTSKDGIFTLISDKENIQELKVYDMQGKNIRHFNTDKPLESLQINLKNVSPQILLFKITLSNSKIRIIKAIR